MLWLSFISIIAIPNLAKFKTWIAENEHSTYIRILHSFPKMLYMGRQHTQAKHVGISYN